MSRTKGTFSLTSNIEPKFGAPLDARTVVKLKTDLTANGTFDYPYIGLTVFVEEENKKYTLVGSDPTVSTNWIEDNSGGHTIKNPAGTAMTQRSNLQFVDLTVSDDSTNDATKVESVHVIQSESELENLPDGLYMLDDDEDTVIDSDLVGYDNTDSGLEATNVKDAIDELAQGGSEVSSKLDKKVLAWKQESTMVATRNYAKDERFYIIPTGEYAMALNPITSGTTLVKDSNYMMIDIDSAIDDLESSINSVNTAVQSKLEESTLASVQETETTMTATKAHAKDSKFYISATQQYCMATTDIAIGDTLVENTNYVAITINGFLTDLESYLILAGQMLDTKADKISSATNGNLAGLNGSGNLTDSGWNGAKDTTSISGNPISISGLKANQLAKDPIITFEPIQDLHGQSKPYPAGGGKNKLNMSDKTISGADWVFNKSECVLSAGTYIFSWNVNLSTSNSCEFQVYDSTGNTIIADVTSNIRTPIQFTITQTAGYCRFYAATGGTFSKFMIRLSTESADYAPYENICPISGYDKVEALSCGKNLLDLSKLGSYQVTESGIMRYGVPAYLKAGTYTFSKSGGSATLYLTNVTDNYSYVEIGSAQYPYTFSVNTSSYVLFRTSGNTPSDWDIVNAQLEEGSSATTYVPYNKVTSISESLGQTVYRTMWYPRTGKLTVDRAIVDLGDLTWNKQSYGFIATISTMLSGRNATEYADNPMVTCSMFATAESLMAEIQNTIRPTYSGVTALSTATIVVFNTSYSDATAFKTAVTGQKLVYPLATPFTIQLTPHEISLLKDYAYLSTNGTNIALDYHNGELASLADVSQLGETVNALSEYFEGKDNAGAYVDLTGTSYITPCDGYLVVDSQSVSSGNIRVQITSNDNTFVIGGIYMHIAGTYQVQTTYIKKGLRLRVVQDVTNTRKRFVPLIP